MSDAMQLLSGVWELIVMGALILLQPLLHMARAKKVQQQLENIKKDVTETKKELSTNGGDSTKDVLNAMNTKLDKCVVDIGSCITDVGAIKTQIENLTFENRARTELTMNQSPMAMYIANEKGNVTFVNAAMANLFGANMAHLINRKRFNFISTQQEKGDAIEALQLSLDTGTDFKMDYTILSRKGQPHRHIKVCDTAEAMYINGNKFLWTLGRIEEMTESN